MRVILFYWWEEKIKPLAGFDRIVGRPSVTASVE